MAGRTGYTAITNGDAYNPAVDMTGILEHFDPLIGEEIDTASNLPASGNWVGRTITAEDTGIVYVNTDGATGWEAAFTAAPIAFTPSVTGVTTSSSNARYSLAGGRCFVEGSFTVSAAPSGTLAVATPLTMSVTNLSDTPRGTCKFIDTGSTAYPGWVDQLSTATTSVRLLVPNVSATYLSLSVVSSTVPFNWASGDKVDYTYSFIPA
jgi:hypothetical protein